MKRLLCMAAMSVLGWTSTGLAARSPAALDAALTDRIGPAPKSFLRQLDDDPETKVSSHTVTPAERALVAKAFGQLTPAQRGILQQRLHEIFFVDGMPNNSLTYPVNSSATPRTYNIAVRAGVLHETVSELVTRKERTLFDTRGSDMSVTVEGGQMNALVYVLLHEATHVMDGALGETPDTGTSGHYPLVDGIWRDRLTPVDAYRQPLLMRAAYRHDGHAIPISEAPATYDALGRTPFISVYGSSNWHDDIAELLAWTQLTTRLHQPYRIVIRKGNNVIRVFEPSKSKWVQARSKSLAPLIDARHSFTS
jgi:hypothetical protein